MAPQIDETSFRLGWIAGFFAAKGFFRSMTGSPYTRKDGSVYYPPLHPICRVRSTNRAELEFIQSHVGGSIYGPVRRTAEGRSPMYELNLRKAEAIEAMNTAYNLMPKHRQQRLKVIAAECNLKLRPIPKKRLMEMVS